MCDATGCLRCAPGYHMYYLRCLTACPSGTYSTSTTCEDCDSSCKTCFSRGKNNTYFKYFSFIEQVDLDALSVQILYIRTNFLIYAPHHVHSLFGKENQI